ncbi:MAG: hypothetical protein QXW00_03585 [Candidatus Woesearchaeota archaeon]
MKPRHFLYILLAIFLFLGFKTASAASCAMMGQYKLCTEKYDYSPTQTVQINGSGFTPAETYLVKVTRPDSSVVTGDGSMQPWPTSYDYVTANSEGKFQFQYILTGMIGEYLIQVLNSEGIVVVIHSFVTNPPLQCPTRVFPTQSVQCVANYIGENDRPAHIIWYDRNNVQKFSDPCNSEYCSAYHSQLTTLGLWTVQLVRDSDNLVLANTTILVVPYQNYVYLYSDPQRTVDAYTFNPGATVYAKVSSSSAEPTLYPTRIVWLNSQGAVVKTSKYCTYSSGQFLDSYTLTGATPGTWKVLRKRYYDCDYCGIGMCFHYSATANCDLDTNCYYGYYTDFTVKNPQVCGNGIVEGSEQCDGGICCNNDCTFKSSNTMCRPSAGICDVAEYCTGSSASCPADIKSTGACRQAVNDCDIEEYCDGVSDACPADSFQPAGTPCEDGLYCTVEDVCDGSGTCSAGAPRDCSANDISEIASCTNEPDGKPFTWDYRASFTSVCDEAMDECTSSNPAMSHTCNKVECNAECEQDSDCNNVHMSGDYCNYAGRCDTENSCACAYTEEYCPEPGTISSGTCYYGIRSCTENGCTLLKKEMGSYKVCDKNLGPMDTTPPIITRLIRGTLGSNGWYVSDVKVEWTVTDEESPVVIDYGCRVQLFNLETAGTTSLCIAHSEGGVSSDSLGLKIDKTGPSALLSVTSGNLGSNGWYVSDVTISTSGEDDVSSPVICTPEQHLSTDSAGTTFHGKCVNDAGLETEAEPLTIKLDKTNPETTLTIGEPKLTISPVYVSASTEFSLSASDATSGVYKTYYWWDNNAETEYTGKITAPGLGEHTLHYYSVDYAGNIEPAKAEDVIVGATRLVLFAQPEVHYSDMLEISAELIEKASSNPIPGMRVRFIVGNNSYEGTTDEHGIAHASIKIEQPAGEYTIEAYFDGEEEKYLQSYSSLNFRVIRENTAIEYTGMTFTSTAGPTITKAPVLLSAHLIQENDGFPGELHLAQVNFVLEPISGGPTITVPNVQVSPSGDAYAVENIPYGNYKISVEITPGNTYWDENPAALSSLTVDLGSNEQRVTGGGWLPDSASSNGKDNFGFTVYYNKRGAPKGNLLFVFRGSDGYNYVLKSNSWAKGGLSFTSENSAMFTAKATLSKINPETGEVLWSDGSYSFVVNVQDMDYAASSSKNRDTLAITIFDSNGAVWKQLGTPSSQIAIGGGNIAVHSK